MIWNSPRLYARASWLAGAAIVGFFAIRGLNTLHGAGWLLLLLAGITLLGCASYEREQAERAHNDESPRV